MARDTKFRADAAFDESLEKRVSAYDRKSERAKRAWVNAREENKQPNSSTYVDVPEFHIERRIDADTGKVSYELGQSINRIATPHIRSLKRLKRRAYYEASGYLHRKVSENEQDNIAVEASHKTEQTGEEAVASLKGMLPSGRTLSRKLQQSIEQKNQRQRQENRVNLFRREMDEYKAAQNQNMFLTKEKGQEVFRQKPVSFAGKNADKVAKATTKDAAEEMLKAEKRKRKKRMRKMAMRELQKETAKKTARATAKGAEAGVGATAATTAAGAGVSTAAASSGAGYYFLYAVLIIVCIILLIFIAALCVFLFVSQKNLQENVLMAMYQSEPEQIEAAELHYSYLEANLQRYMEELEDSEEGYDGYVIDEAAGIGHNPYTLINYLSAKYGQFEYADVESEIDELYQESYTLTTWVEDIDVTPSEEETSEDPGEEPSEEPEPVTLHIFHVKLTKKSLEEIVSERMDEEETERYDLYGETHGGFQFVASPTGDDFTGRISSYYGYRYHPIREEIRLHRGLDIALAEGTELYAGINGTITAATEDPGGYGKYITITGEDGVQVRYGHMSEFLVSEGDVVRCGDLIGKSGNTGASTGPHVHVEVLEGGNYYNPLFYLDTE
ncbi:MAG: M23 family metallopeptidase [Lachnospiraceae bacterium]|nr:M23 family metallopeptidase [Lachnospiraceae bacterium]